MEPFVIMSKTTIQIFFNFFEISMKIIFTILSIKIERIIYDNKNSQPAYRSKYFFKI
jgi:hypothetical protein